MFPPVCYWFVAFSSDSLLADLARVRLGADGGSTLRSGHGSEIRRIRVQDLCKNEPISTRPSDTQENCRRLCLVCHGQNVVSDA